MGFPLPCQGTWRPRRVGQSYRSGLSGMHYHSRSACELVLTVRKFGSLPASTRTLIVARHCRWPHGGELHTRRAGRAKPVRLYSPSLHLFGPAQSHCRGPAVQSHQPAPTDQQGEVLIPTVCRAKVGHKLGNLLFRRRWEGQYLFPRQHTLITLTAAHLHLPPVASQLGKIHGTPPDDAPSASVSSPR
jgi:hypothetical protein